MWKFRELDCDEKPLEESISRLLSTTHTGSVSISVDRVFSFTAYLAMSGNEFWLTSKDTTEHILALSDRRLDAAVCLWQQPNEWGEPLFGVQFSGVIEVAVDHEMARQGLSALHKRFPGTHKTLPSVDHVFGENRVTCLQRVSCNTGKFRDERRLGKGIYEIEWRPS